MSRTVVFAAWAAAAEKANRIRGKTRCTDRMSDYRPELCAMKTILRLANGTGSLARRRGEETALYLGLKVRAFFFSPSENGRA
jgi:hypothetical protein